MTVYATSDNKKKLIPKREHQITAKSQYVFEFYKCSHVINAYAKREKLSGNAQSAPYIISARCVPADRDAVPT